MPNTLAPETQSHTLQLIAIEPALLNTVAGSLTATEAASMQLLPTTDLPNLRPRSSGCLVVTVSPARYLAHLCSVANPQPAPRDIEAMLRRWSVQAQTTFNWVMAHRERCLVVDFDECRLAPEAFMRLLVHRLGGGASEPHIPRRWMPEPVDPLLELLANQVVAQDARLADQHAELLACCHPLTDESAAAAHEGPGAALQRLEHWLAQREASARQRAESEEASARWESARSIQVKAVERTQEVERQLAGHLAAATESARSLQLERQERESQQSRHELERRSWHALEARLREELERLRSELHAAQEQVERLTLEPASSIDLGTNLELEPLRKNLLELQKQAAELSSRNAARLQELTEESEGMLAHLHDVQVQLDVAQQGRVMAERALQATQVIQSQTSQQLKASHLLQRQLQLQLDGVMQALLESRGALESTTRAGEASRQQLAQAQQASVAAQSQLALLRRQAEERLAEAQAAIQQLHEGWLAATVTRPCVLQEAGPGQATVHAASVLVLHTRDAAPHREMNLRLERLRIGGRTWPAVEVRLVEHHGHAGLVLLTQPGDAPLLAHWNPQSQDKGRPFMLLLPQDPRSRREIEAMGSSDWLILQGLVTMMEPRIREQAPGGSIWPVVAARLRAALMAMPQRLRYDRLEVRESAALPERRLAIELKGVTYGGLALPALQMAWGAGPLDRQLLLQLHPSCPAEPPLSCWPVTPSGQLAGEMPVPLGAGGSRTDAMRWWAALGTQDRDILLGLLDALQAAATSAPPPTRPWQDRARQLRRAAGRLSFAGRLGLSLLRRRKG